MGTRRWGVRPVGGRVAGACPLARAQNADSWATDAHKWLNVPYDSGVVFIRDADALRAAMASRRISSTG